MKKSTVLKSFRGGSDALIQLIQERDGDMYVEKSASGSGAIKLKTQYQWLREFQKIPGVPKLLGKNSGSDFFSYKLKYYGDYEEFVGFIQSKDPFASFNLITNILENLEKSLHQRRLPNPNRLDLNQYIEDKVIRKLEQCRPFMTSSDLFQAPALTINGKMVRSVRKSLELILGNDRFVDSLLDRPSCEIHGDLTVENILVRESDFVLLDPNGDNFLSDVTVEIGKLFQSLHSKYEFFDKIRHTRTSGVHLEIQWPQSQPVSEVFQLFKQYCLDKFGPQGLLAIYFHEAIHFSRLLPYKARKMPHLFAPFFAKTCLLFDNVASALEQKFEQTHSRNTLL